MIIQDALDVRDALAWALGLIGVLWSVTVILAGALAHSMRTTITEMAADLKVIAQGHAALEATVNSHAERIERTEDAQIRLEEWRHSRQSGR